MAFGTNGRWLRRAAFALLFIALGVLLAFAGFLAWVKALYPDTDDPKNFYYALWKHGLNNNMDRDTALRAMTHDRWPVKRVEGLSRAELEERFGYIRNYDSAPHMRGCYAFEALQHPRATEVVSLRDSLWVVALEKGKAFDLLLCKG